LCNLGTGLTLISFGMILITRPLATALMFLFILAGVKINNRILTLRLAYILIPIGIFAWIAFSLPTIMVNYAYIISVFSDPLGQGWDRRHAF
jgi:hypothetical protein